MPSSCPRRAREPRATCRIEIIGPEVLAQLEGSDISHDRPSVLDGDLRRVTGHAAEPVGRHVEEITNLDVPEPVDMKRFRLAKSTPRHHATTGPQRVVTGGAVDVIPLAAAAHDGIGDLERK